jgi:AcrR family transcriptional regulator
MVLAVSGGGSLVDRSFENETLPLAREQRNLTRSRIRQAAMEVVARRGFNATIAEIAEVSGVSGRTIIRHYVNHDHLIAETVTDMFEACGLPRRSADFDRWVESVPGPGDDLDEWIRFIAVTFHTRTASIFGAAFWSIYSPPKRHESEVLTEIAALRRHYRLRGMSYLVNLVWRTAGGTGEPPEDLVMAFALNLSAFTTHALMIDFDQTPDQIGILTADVLAALLRRAVHDQQAAREVADR